MAWRLFDSKPLSKPVLGYWQLNPSEQTNFNQNTTLFIYENASENIGCEMASILSREMSLQADQAKYKQLHPLFYLSIVTHPCPNFDIV